MVQLSAPDWFVAEENPSTQTVKDCWVRKIGFTVRHCGHLLYKLNQIIVACQHERIDHNAGFAAGLDLFESFVHHEGIAAHRVLVKPALAGHLAVPWRRPAGAVRGWSVAKGDASPENRQLVSRR